MISETPYDVAIVGGGLAGLACAIVCAKSGSRVVLFEKETYPFHKVCGEYISLESLAFLNELGFEADTYALPLITVLELSSPSGKVIKQQLPLGGIGISRYTIDNLLVNNARKENVFVSEGNRVNDIKFENDHFIISSETHPVVKAKVCCGAFGKRSNLDVKWKRAFVQKKAGSLNNFIAVKYHAFTDHPRHVISLHNFHGGYCGISPVEDNKTCICYLTNAQNLRLGNNNIREMEQKILARNPFLKKTFMQANILYDKPLTISQISFNKKEQVIDHVLMLGDAAGLITPLCGNGMSMALHSGRIASGLIADFLSGKINRQQMENTYKKSWTAMFSNRLIAGRWIQSLFGKEWITNTVIALLKPFPGIVRRIIRKTHGSL